MGEALDIIYLEGQIQDDSTLSVQFEKPVFINELVVLSVTTNSEPFLIPKRKYKFKFGQGKLESHVVETDERNFPALVDLLKNLTKKASGLELFLQEDKDRQTIVAVFANEAVELKCGQSLGFLFGLNQVDDDGFCVMSCYNKNIQYLLLKPVTPGVVNINLLETYRSNVQKKNLYGDGSKPRFRIGTIPAGDQPLRYKTFGSLEHKFQLGEAIELFRLEIIWSDGVPYVPRNQNIAINIAYK